MRDRAVRSAAVVCLAGLFAFVAGPARARLEFPSMAERVMGVRAFAAPSSARPGGEPVGLRVECGDTEMFGIAGLRASGARASAARGAAFAGVEYVQTASPVGAHARAVVEAGGVAHGAWQGAVRLGAERLTLDGFPAHRIAIAGLFNRVDVGPVAAIADIEVADDVRGRTTAVSLSVLARAGFAELAASLRIDDGRLAATGVGMAARVHARLVLFGGFDDTTETVRAGALVSWRALEVGIGAFHHAVLGGSQGVSVAWAR